MAQMGSALPQASTNGEAVGHIVILKEGLDKGHLDEHLKAVKGVQKRSDRDDTSETGVKHIIDGIIYGFQGYTGVFTPEELKFIKDHEHVDYVEEDIILSEPLVETREVSDRELAVEDEIADTDAKNVPAGSAGGPNRQKSTIGGGTLSWGQGYSTLLGKGLRVDVVVPLTDNVKRDNPTMLNKTNPATVLNETNPVTAYNFTAPSANLTGVVNLLEYFAEPDPDTIFDDLPDVAPEEVAEENGKRAVVNIPGCTGKIHTHFKLTEDYDSYMHALDMSNDALTFVATIEIEKQQDYQNGHFDAASYTPDQFYKTHGDRWIKGYKRGGKLMARLIFRANDTSKTKEVKAHAQAALRFWGVSGDVSVSVKDSMEQVEKHAEVDITMFQEGNLGTFMTGTDGAVSEKSSFGSASGSFKQVKEWADKFMQQACDHNFAYRPVLEEYTTLPGFPTNQRVHDYGTVRIMSNRILRELVKLSELVTTITRHLEDLGGYDEKIFDMHFEFLDDIVTGSKEWVEQAAENPRDARSRAKSLMSKFRKFNLTWKDYLSPYAALLD
ncbi:Subtilisin-like protease [Beauveria bassiana]|nr:Subtilisin-like protease [Beauveria bassiana]